MRSTEKAFLPITALTIAVLLCGCSTSPQTCSNGTTVTEIAPAVATADHMAVAPGDQQKFTEFTKYTPPASGMVCPMPEVIQAPPVVTWTASDNTDIKISSAQDATNGLATCLGTTKTAVTVTAIGTPVNGGTGQVLGTATLSCK